MHTMPSSEDVIFKDRFEAGDVGPTEFGHREHLRLAYVYLCDSGPTDASARMRRALTAFLSANNVPTSKFHETLTQSWVLAVRYFMAKVGPVASFDAFLAADDRLLNSDIMLTHYTRETLFSEEARAEFIPPDIAPIPSFATL